MRRINQKTNAGAAEARWTTGFLSSCEVSLEPDPSRTVNTLVITRRFAGRAGRTQVQRVPADRLDPTPRRLIRHNPLLFWLIAVAVAWALGLSVDWSTRSLTNAPHRLAAAAGWGLLALLLYLQFSRVTGVFNAWIYRVSREVALEIPERISERFDLAALLRIPELPDPTSNTLAGSSDDRRQQLDDLLRKGHISDEEYLRLTNQALEATRRWPT